MTTKYTEEHEWINIEDHEAAVVGITLHAQDALGDVVFVELPEVGRSYKKGEVAGVVQAHHPLGPAGFGADELARGQAVEQLVGDQDQRRVGRRHGKVAQFPRVKPFQRLALARDHRPLPAPAGVKRHQQMEVVVGVTGEG